MRPRGPACCREGPGYARVEGTKASKHRSGEHAQHNHDRKAPRMTAAGRIPKGKAEEDAKAIKGR